MEIRNLPTGNVLPRAEGLDPTRSSPGAADEVSGRRPEGLSGATDARTSAEGRDMTSSQDTVRLSALARALSAEVEPGELAGQQARIESLRAEIAGGTLASPDRIARTVRKLIGG